jgi:hypothetical protein
LEDRAGGRGGKPSGVCQLKGSGRHDSSPRARTIPLPGPPTLSAGFSAMHKFLALRHVALCHVVARFATSFMVEFA